MKKFEYLRVYNSPFKPPKIKLYYGKVAIGTPYFLPRKWVKNGKGYLTAVPRKIGFDFVGLGWKTKYDDYRFEWSPLISFVFFKWQIAVTFVAPELDHYWESWLYYTRETKGTTKQRIAQCRKEAPQIWTTTKSDGTRITINYYNKILKTKWLI
jgi:hypothetical protein